MYRGYDTWPNSTSLAPLLAELAMLFFFQITLNVLHNADLSYAAANHDFHFK